MQNVKRVSGAGLTCLVLVLCGSYAREEHYPSSASTVPDDFPVYYVAASIARRGRRERLYVHFDRPYSVPMIVGGKVEPGTAWDRVARSSGLGPTLHFITPPFDALLLEPLARLPWQRAFLMWRLLTGLMVVLAVYLALLLARPQQPFLPLLVVSVAAALSFFPYLQTLWFGQINGLILLLWALGAYFVSRHKPVASALCFAVGTAVKISPVLVVGLFALRRQWRWLVAYGIGSGLLLLVSVWRLGWQNHWDWLHLVYPTLACGVPYLENRSLPAFFMDLYFGRAPFNNIPASVPSLLCLVDKAASGIVYLGVLYAFWRKNKSSGGLTYEVILMAIVSLLISPASWRHHFMLALLPLCYLWVLLLKRPAGHGDAELKALIVATLILGVKAPEYAVAKIPILSIGVVGLWVAAAAFVIWIGMRMYEGSVETMPAS